MIVADRMTREPFVVDPTTPMAECRQIMRECRIHHLPVVDNGQLVGLLHARAAFGRHPTGATAADLATRAHLRAFPDESLYDVLGRCTASLDDACVVTDREHRVVGIVTDRDVVRMAAELVEPSMQVEAVATSTLRTVRPHIRICDALDEMRTAMARHLVVTDGLRLVGVVSLLQVLAARDPRAPVASVLGQEPEITVRWGAPLVEAARSMRDADLDALAVVADDDPRTVEGLVTVTDLLRALRLSPAIARSGSA